MVLLGSQSQVISHQHSFSENKSNFSGQSLFLSSWDLGSISTFHFLSSHHAPGSTVVKMNAIPQLEENLQAGAPVPFQRPVQDPPLEKAGLPIVSYNV